jgi:hypothetical protein
MMMCRVFCAVLSTFTCLPAQGTSRRLEGCPDPAKLAPVLTTLQRHKWVGMSAEDLANIWPIGLDDTNSCEPHCQVILSEDRIIRGRIECGTSFRFETSTNPDGSETTQLKSIVINYLALAAADHENVKKTLLGAFHIGRDIKKSKGYASSDPDLFPILSWTDQEPERRSL